MCWWETSHRSNIQYAWKWACYRGSLSQRSDTSISHPHRCFQLLCLIRPLLRRCGCVQTQLEICCTITYWLMVRGLLWLNVIPGVTPPTKTTRVCVCRTFKGIVGLLSVEFQVLAELNYPCPDCSFIFNGKIWQWNRIISLKNNC